MEKIRKLPLHKMGKDDALGHDRTIITIYIVAFYTGVVVAAITEQHYKERYWEEHLGGAPPLMKPRFYDGPWKVMRGDVPPMGQ